MWFSDAAQRLTKATRSPNKLVDLASKISWKCEPDYARSLKPSLPDQRLMSSSTLVYISLCGPHGLHRPKIQTCP